MAKRKEAYFESSNLLFHGQHGFGSHHSCESALHEIVTECLSNMDKKLVNLILFMDFKKAKKLLINRSKIVNF